MCSNISSQNDDKNPQKIVKRITLPLLIYNDQYAGEAVVVCVEDEVEGDSERLAVLL